MHIAFIGQKEFPATGREIDRYIEELAIRLAERGNEVFSYVEECHNGKDSFVFEGVNFVRVPGFGSRKTRRASHFLFVILKIIFKKYDVVHFQGTEASFFGIILKILKRKTAFISTFHSRNYLQENRGVIEKKILKLSEKIFFDISERIITTSKTLKKYALSQYRKNIIHVPTGPSLKYTNETKSLERWELKEKKYIVMEIRPEINETVEKIISAFKKIENTSKIANGFKLLLLGDALLDNKQKNFIKKLIKGRKSIIFTEKQSRSSVEQLLSNAYLFIQPSCNEETPMRLIEAMNAKTAPLVCENHGNLETIGKCGFVFNSKSTENIEEVMSYILNKPTEVQRAGKMSRERIQKQFSWESITRKTLHIYELAVEGKEKKKLNALNKKAESYV